MRPDKNCVLGVRRKRTIGRNDGPTIGKFVDVVVATSKQHGLYGQNDPRLKQRSTTVAPAVLNVGLLVHGLSDSVSAVVVRAAIPGERHHRIDGGADITKMSARNHRCDASCERPVGGVNEQLGRSRPASDEHRERRISVPTVHDCSTVDRQQIAFVEYTLAGDAVDHFVVHRRTDDSAETAMTKEIGSCLAPSQYFAGDRIEIERRHARPHRLTDCLVHLGHYASSSSHVLDLFKAPTRKPCLAATHYLRRLASTAVVSRANTSSGLATPSTTVSRPVAW